MAPSIPSVQDQMNKAWKSTCTTIFGKELGELSDYEPYLKEAVVGKEVTSHFSGKKLWVATEQYCEGAKFFDYTHEDDLVTKMSGDAAKPLDINKIKDIDSIMEQIGERAVYSGNKILGNCNAVERSDAVSNGVDMLNCSIIINGKFQAYTYVMQNSEYAFGSTSSGQSTHILRCYYNNSLRRCFECCSSVGLSDSFFCYSVFNSNDCMFSFNQHVLQYAIANVRLEKSAYFELKKKLLSEIMDELQRKKRYRFSIIDLLNGDACA